MTGPITEDDLAVLRLVHAALRRDLALFTAELDDTAHYPADLSRLRRAWANFARQLHDHHTAEDELIWPTLRHRAGAAAEPVLASMTAEHATIDPAIHEVEHAMSAAIGEPHRAADLQAALTRLRELVEGHLTHEEAEASRSSDTTSPVTTSIAPLRRRGAKPDCPARKPSCPGSSTTPQRLTAGSCSTSSRSHCGGCSHAGNASGGLPSTPPPMSRFGFPIGQACPLMPLSARPKAPIVPHRPGRARWLSLPSGSIVRRRCRSRHIPTAPMIAPWRSSLRLVSR